MSTSPSSTSRWKSNGWATATRWIRRLTLTLVLLPGWAYGQSFGTLDVNDPTQFLLKRLELRGHLDSPNLDLAPLSVRRRDALLAGIDGSQLGPLDTTLIAQTLGTMALPLEQKVHALWGALYERPGTFYQVGDADYTVTAEPWMLLGTGLPFQRTDNRGSYSLQSTRGFRLAGRIGTRITFESRMTQNRLIEVGPIRDFERKVRRVGSIPGAGMSLGWGRGGDGYDYAENEVHFLDAVGIIAYEDDYFNIRFGRDRNRYGFAQGSPLLSPIHAPIDQLQILFNTDKFSYGMLLMSLVSPDKRAVRGQLSPVNVVGEANPRRFSAVHRVSVHVGKRLEFSIAEAVVLYADSLGSQRGMDLAYLNPLTLYNASERDLGSPDNTMMEVAGRLRLFDRMALYGHAHIDEAPNARSLDWWGTKWALVGGLEAADLGLKGSLLMVEMAAIRPYMYSHRSTFSSYTHYNDVLGHPAEANAYDYMLRWHLMRPRIQAGVLATYTLKGRSTSTENYGSSAIEPYGTRVSEYGVTLGWGVRQTRSLVDAFVEYAWLPKLFTGLYLRHEVLDDALLGEDQFSQAGVYMRWGMPYPWQR